MSARRVRLSTGGAARIATGDPGDHAIVLLPAIAGINPYIESLQAELVADGFAVAVIDYWARAGGAPDLSSLDKIMAAVGEVADPDVTADVAEVCQLFAPVGVTVLGFCIGGTQALIAAADVESVTARCPTTGCCATTRPTRRSQSRRCRPQPG